MSPSDLKVKCGEWKLGIDDEPKPFQITGVRSISFHPSYNPANLNNDVALLHCDERIRYDTHVGPICLEDQYTSASSDDCVTTGWGKEVLRSELERKGIKFTILLINSLFYSSSPLEGSNHEPSAS